MKIDPRMKAPNVEVSGDVLEIEEFSVDGIAEALAEDLQAAVAAQPGQAWDRTGHLKRGIAANGGDVTVPSDRLQRDDLAERFASEVMANVHPESSQRVRQAEERALDETVKRR